MFIILAPWWPSKQRNHNHRDATFAKSLYYIEGAIGRPRDQQAWTDGKILMKTRT
jgi:hypothetical protein